MKLPWEKKHICYAIMTFVTIAACVLFYMALQKWEVVEDFLKLAGKSLRPVSYGLILAYLINPLVNMFEYKVVWPLLKKLCKKSGGGKRGITRAIAIILTWVLVCAVGFALFALVMPEIIKSIEMLVANLPTYANHILDWFDTILKQNPAILKFLKETVSGFTTDLASLINRVADMIPNINVLLVGVSTSIYSVFVAVVNVLVGIIVSIYVLKDKEKFVAQSKKIIYSVFSIERGNSVLSLFRLTHEKFGNFITGKIFDSFIIGMLCFLVLTLFGMPYSALISVVVGVTNVIPFFGPFIGAIPSAILILCVDPIKCVTFIIIILIIQQFDGNILGPKILGSTTGVSSFWVLTSILVGSGLFGIWGMICAVPMFAVIYHLVAKYCHKALKKKKIDYSLETYERLVSIDEKTGSPEWKK